MKNLLFVFVLFSLISACEVDDICTEDVQSPRLVIGFYDQTSPGTKKDATGLYVWAEGKDSLYKADKLNKIELPLPIDSNTTKYMIESEHVIDTLHVFHHNNEVFISRSCGYIYHYSLDNETTLSNHWTSSFEYTTEQQIENETDEHIKIYH